jgi:propanol-preferring alcohol dehydrogenase
MQGMLLRSPGRALEWTELPDRTPGPNEIRVRVSACGVCRTDLHVVDGELPDPKLPIVPGHEIVGRVEALGAGVSGLEIGERVGIPWLAHTCGVCAYCVGGQENLCNTPLFTGYTRDGGYATAAIADARYAFPLGEAGEDSSLAPLMCAGLIGWRSLKIAGEGRRLGLYGFGAAAHIIAQVARAQGREVFAFTRPGDATSQAFARELGASWVGGSNQAPPVQLDAAIIYAPLGELVPAALAAVRKGGRVVCAGIHMSDIPSFPYRLLWEERSVTSVANLTRSDGLEFLRLASQIGIATHTRCYTLGQANQALSDLRTGRLQGAAVLTVAAGDEPPQKSTVR